MSEQGNCKPQKPQEQAGKAVCGVLPMVETLQGPVAVAELGLTLMHEHILYEPPARVQTSSIEYARDSISDFLEAGGRTLVELTPHRDLKQLLACREGLSVQIICSTGCYLECVVAQVTPHIYALQEHEQIERMQREIEQGIDDTGVKAGIIKIAGDGARLTPWEEQIFRAAAQVSTVTKTPIATHACAGQAAQQKALAAAGADLSHVYYSHVEAEFGWEGRSVKEEIDLLASLMREGSSMLFNNFGFPFDTPEEDLIRLLQELSQRGFIDRLLISVDMNFDTAEDGSIWPEASREHPETRSRTYAWLLREIIPWLQAKVGWSLAECDQVLRLNPRRIFTWNENT